MSDLQAAAAVVVGAWEVNAPAAPFPWHVMTFTPFGTMSQSNPHAGNQDESDSAGHGVWEQVATEEDGVVIRGKFVEYKADHQNGAYIGKGMVVFSFTVTGDTFAGDSQAYRYDATGQLTRGPLASPISGQRITLDSLPKPE